MYLCLFKSGSPPIFHHNPHFLLLFRDRLIIFLNLNLTLLDMLERLLIIYKLYGQVC